jgi:hypothetical protein
VKKLNRFVPCLVVVAALLLSACGGKASPGSPEKGDVYFGLLKSVDTANRIIHMEVHNINIRERAEKEDKSRSFYIHPNAKIIIEQPNGKMMPNMTLHNVAVSRWVWVATHDGEISADVAASSYVSFRGHLTKAEGNQITLKLNRRRVGRRVSSIGEKTPPRTFNIPGGTSILYKGQPVSPSLIGVGAHLEVTSLEGGGVVLITVHDDEG